MITCTNHNSSYHNKLGLLCFQYLPSNNHFQSEETSDVSPRKTWNHRPKERSYLEQMQIWSVNHIGCIVHRFIIAIVAIIIIINIIDKPI